MKDNGTHSIQEKRKMGGQIYGVCLHIKGDRLIDANGNVVISRRCDIFRNGDYISSDEGVS